MIPMIEDAPPVGATFTEGVRPFSAISGDDNDQRAGGRTRPPRRRLPDHRDRYAAGPGPR